LINPTTKRAGHDNMTKTIWKIDIFGEFVGVATKNAKVTNNPITKYKSA